MIAYYIQGRLDFLPLRFEGMGLNTSVVVIAIGVHQIFLLVCLQVMRTDRTLQWSEWCFDSAHQLLRTDADEDKDYAERGNQYMTLHFQDRLPKPPTKLKAQSMSSPRPLLSSAPELVRSR